MRLSHFDTELVRPSAVAFGVFDGLHRGHQALIAEVVRRAHERGAHASVVTFDPHPALVLSPSTAPLLIGTIDQRLEGLEQLGVEQVGLMGFDHVAAGESAASFVERVLVRQLGVIDLVVGDDVHFGRDREGDIALLVREGDRHGFRVHASSTYGDVSRFSSSAVRARLAAGDVAAAAEILGRAFVLRGTVVHGDARGREIGFATANVGTGERQQLPALGVYAGAVRLESGQWRCGAVSVGTRPQFYEDGALLVEVHLPGFEGDLYGQRLDVAFLERLRGEASFATLEELVVQMGRDVARSLEIFEKFSPTSSVLLG
ncbi:MAG: bifunctional riboflavin kinase/FAD synthetase [Acidobacteria bacterium]|nr:bifunctional riboflavin kinase/FAD synthetase [Acidobacteriota bacterium]